MTERFNFYDLYGYLIPGMSLLALVSLPFGISARDWPDLEWSSAFVFLVAAYVVGLLLNRTTSGFMPVRVYDDAEQTERYPSEVLLTSDSSRARTLLGVGMSDDLRTNFVKAFEETFEGMKASDSSTYFLSRGLVQAESSSYAEQFQGMYTLCQMLAASLLLSGWYFLGWAVGDAVPQQISFTVLGISVIAFCATHFVGRGEWPFLTLPIVMISLGSTLAASGSADRDVSVRLFTGLSIISAALSFPLLAAFRNFRGLHAIAVYQAFYVWYCARALDERSKSDKKGS